MNFKKALVFFGVSTPICILLNCLIMFFTVESKSGFFRTGYNSLALIMILIIAALIILNYVSFAKIKKPAAPDFWKFVYSACSFILGVCLFVETFNFTPLIGTGKFFAELTRVFGILSGVTFLACAVENLFGVKFFKPIYIIPVVYYIFRIIFAFIYYAAVATIVETAFELFAICAMLIFTMNFAKAQNGIKNKKGKSLPLNVSAICAITVITQIVPYAVNVFSKQEILLHANSLFIPSSISLFLFIIASSLFANKNEITEE